MATDRELLLAIQHSLQLLHRKVDIQMTQQDDLNALGTRIEADDAALATAIAAIKAALDAALAAQAAGQPVDLTGIQAAVGDLDAVTATAQADVPPPAGP